MNIATDLHVTLPVDSYGRGGWINQVQKPLNKIPHCNLGEISRFEALYLYAFFPRLALNPG
jgi:hypothetical protein